MGEILKLNWKPSSRMGLRVSGVLLALLVVGGAPAARAQDLPLTQVLMKSDLRPLDPARDVANPVLESATHKPLPEEYIWTAADGAASDRILYTFPGIAEQTEPHGFRTHFRVERVPTEATLYIAGPRSVSVWVNGQLADRVTADLGSPLNMHVFQTDVARFLKPGDNLLAIQAVRGRGVTGFANSALVRQQTFGQVLVAKIIPQGRGVNGPDLMHSSPEWRSAAVLNPGWEKPGFADAAWSKVVTLGGIEGNIELFQWNADAGLYDWPGYNGISGFLAHLPLAVHGVLATYTGRGSFEGLDSLTKGDGELHIHLPAERLTDSEAPSVLLDFGRELTGRLEIVSNSATPVVLTMQLGESEAETLQSPLLGVNQLTLAPHATGYSSKTAFRYAKVRF